MASPHPASKQSSGSDNGGGSDRTLPPLMRLGRLPKVVCWKPFPCLIVSFSSRRVVIHMPVEATKQLSRIRSAGCKRKEDCSGSKSQSACDNRCKGLRFQFHHPNEAVFSLWSGGQTARDHVGWRQVTGGLREW